MVKIIAVGPYFDIQIGLDYPQLGHSIQIMFRNIVDFIPVGIGTYLPPSPLAGLPSLYTFKTNHVVSDVWRMVGRYHTPYFAVV